MLFKEVVSSFREPAYRVGSREPAYLPTFGNSYTHTYLLLTYEIKEVWSMMRSGSDSNKWENASPLTRPKDRERIVFKESNKKCMKVNGGKICFGLIETLWD
ncbi:hypothetical protein AVEN_160311-1 [Araneus ventricosus]|uniref:Uncharacterized protein n=1 Tax=Araneus ventricosus TaxID=182803 RepID=A0A4Y2FBM2_ARAVE|nr:hypothetical protein AVEN_160311-1 [Araneus ventricosus]